MRAAWLLAVFVLAACQTEPRGDERVGLDWSVEPTPPTAGSAVLTLRLTDSASRQPLAGATVGLTGDMTHPGMQPVFATAREVTPGRYEAPIELTMAGDWVISVDARFPDGRRFEKQIDLPGVRPRPGER